MHEMLALIIVILCALLWDVRYGPPLANSAVDFLQVRPEQVGVAISFGNRGGQLDEIRKPHFRRQLRHGSLF